MGGMEFKVVLGLTIVVGVVVAVVLVFRMEVLQMEMKSVKRKKESIIDGGEDNNTLLFSTKETIDQQL
jgi:hypothetical protein